MLHTAMQSASGIPQNVWVFGGALLLVLLLAIAWIVSLSLRRMVGAARGSGGPDWRPSTENPAIFMSASMQAVIQRLREQEKELEAL